MVKLNRKTELYLIDLGLQKVLSNLVAPTVKKVKKPKGRKWTPAQHAKFLKSMKKTWKKKNGHKK